MHLCAQQSWGDLEPLVRTTFDKTLLIDKIAVEAARPLLAQQPGQEEGRCAEQALESRAYLVLAWL